MPVEVGSVTIVPREATGIPWMHRCRSAFLTNALHCARDPAITMQRIDRMLNQGGLFLIAEGQPWTNPGVPWALNVPFGMVDGWWDRGGFLDRAKWLACCASSGM